MPAGVDVAAAGGEVVRLDGVHDGDADPGGGADVVDGQPGRDARLLQGTADGEAGFLGRVFERTLVFRGVADGHGGAFRACSHLCWRFSLGGVRRVGQPDGGLCTPSEWPDTPMTGRYAP